MTIMASSRGAAGQIDALSAQINTLTSRIEDLIAEMPRPPRAPMTVAVAARTPTSPHPARATDPTPGRPHLGAHPNRPAGRRVGSIRPSRPGAPAQRHRAPRRDHRRRRTQRAGDHRRDWAGHERFTTPGHLVGWAKLCPRTIQSGPVTRGGRTGKGNPYLKGALGQAAAAAARTDTFLGQRYRRPAFSSTTTCFCTAAKLISYFTASAETECSPASTRRMMSRRVRSASAWNRASARSSLTSVTEQTYNQWVVGCQGPRASVDMPSMGTPAVVTAPTPQGQRLQKTVVPHNVPSTAVTRLCVPGHFAASVVSADLLTQVRPRLEPGMARAVPEPDGGSCRRRATSASLRLAM